MTIKTTLWFAAAAVLAAAVTLPAVRADETKATSQPASQPAAAVNAKCPITGEDVDSKVTTTYDGKTYAFCCADCVKAFNKDPAKFAAKAK